jgi:hypothetical protein
MVNGAYITVPILGGRAGGTHLIPYRNIWPQFSNFLPRMFPRCTIGGVDPGFPARSCDVRVRSVLSVPRLSRGESKRPLRAASLQLAKTSFVPFLILTRVAVPSRTKKERDGIRAAVASVVARAFPWTRRPHPPPHRPAVCSGSRGQSQAPVRVRVRSCVALGLGALARTGPASPSSPVRRAAEPLKAVGPMCSPICARVSPPSSAALLFLPHLHLSVPHPLSACGRWAPQSSIIVSLRASMALPCTR